MQVLATPFAPGFARLEAGTTRIFSSFVAFAASLRSVNGDGPDSMASLAMARYGRGDDSAFADVYDELSPRLFRYLVASAFTFTSKLLASNHQNVSSQ